MGTYCPWYRGRTESRRGDTGMAKSDARRTKGQAKPGKERGAPGAVRAREDAKTDRGGGESSNQAVVGCPWGRSCSYPQCLCGVVVGGDYKPTFRCFEGFGQVGMEAGANNGGSERESTEAKGGEWPPSVFGRPGGPGVSELGAERNMQGGHPNRSVQWLEGWRAAQVTYDTLKSYQSERTEQQNREAKARTYRWAGAALLIGVTLGLFLPLAYQMVSRG